MSAVPEIELGAFRLLHPLGAGGQGAVWQARHLPTGTDVAIKVLASRGARQAGARAMFRREVRAAAGLDHENVIVVLDQGTVDERAAGASRGELPQDSPWLAMELARASLQDLPGRRTWDEVRAILQGLLAGLAHAHARGLVHRDLKPANSLFMEPPRVVEDLRRVRLADFGLAFAADELDRDGAPPAAGTPLYMAPEQFRGDLADIGPQADLYALGWLAWELATGGHPLRSLSVPDIRNLKSSGWQPAWPSGVVAPPGFDTWIRRLLAVDPRQRPRCAADAALALEQLGEAPLQQLAPPSRSARTTGPPLGPSLPDGAPQDGAPQDGAPQDGALQDSTRQDGALAGRTTQLDADQPRYGRQQVVRGTTEPTLSLGDLAADEPGGPNESASRRTWTAWESIWEERENPEPAPWPEELPPLPAPPVPQAWRRPEGRRNAAPAGAGLGLFGLRVQVPIGREPTQDRLWAALRAVAEEGRPRAVLVRGAAGEGATMLCRWLGEHAAELGVAWSLRLSAGPRASAPGAAGMLAQLLRHPAERADLGLEAARAGLAALGVVDAVDARVLCAIMGLSDGPPPPTMARHAALAALVASLAVERPVVLHVDDAPHADELLSWIEGLLHRRDLRCLVVLGAREEDLAVRPEVARRLLELSAEALPLGPLSEGASRALVRQVLGIETTLLSDLVRRATGNPSFLVQLLGDWVSRGLLVPSPRGCVLADNAQAELPADLHAAWLARVAQLARDQGSQAPLALEVAAVLGVEFERRLWSSACARLGIRLPPHLEEHLLDHALLRPAAVSRSRLVFAHGALRESLLRRAEEAGHRADLHRACAEELAATAGPPGATGLHLARAGEPAAAVPLLLRGAETALDGDDRAMAQRLLGQTRKCLEQTARPPEHPDMLRAGILGGRLDLREGRFAAATAELLGVIEAAAAAGQVEREREARSWHAAAAMGALDLATARDEAEAVLASIDASPDPLMALRMHLLLGQVAAATGDFAAAETSFAMVTRGWGADGQGGDPLGPVADLAAQALVGRMGVAKAQGDLDRALQQGQRATELLERHGQRRRLAQVLNEQGDILRRQGDLGAARSAYGRAEQLADALGGAHGVVMRINLGLTDLAEGRFAAAATLLGRALAEARAQGHYGYEYAVRHALLPCAAANYDPAAVVGHLDRIEELRLTAHFADADLAQPAEQAAELLRAAGSEAEARRCQALAREQWRQLGHAEDAARLDEAVACEAE